MFNINYGSIVAWAHNNQLAVTLAASAIIGTMPQTLPTIREFPQWAWTWVHDSSKTFMNFRKTAGPGGEVIPPIPALVVPPVVPPPVTPPQQLNG